MGEEDVDEVCEHVVGKAMLEMVDLCLGFAAEEAGEGTDRQVIIGIGICRGRA